MLNTIGMLIGSSVNFFLGRRFGPSLVRAFISDADYGKYMHKMNDCEGFKWLLRIGFIAPIFPDDIFCMIAGMSNLRFHQFFGMVLAYRPASVFVYTFITSTAIKWVFNFFA